MSDPLLEFITGIGPQYAGWAIAGWLFYRMTRLGEIGHRTIDRNTEALVAFRTLLEERVPRGGAG